MASETDLASENEVLRSFAIDFVTSLGKAVPAFIELVVHDLAELPNSVVVITGNVTGRRAGDPATNLLLQQIASGKAGSMVGYSTRLPNGRELRSSTLVMRNSREEPVVAVCVNVDLSAWFELKGLVDSMFDPAPGLASIFPQGTLVQPAPVPLPEFVEPQEKYVSESFVQDIDELTEIMLNTAIAEIGVPVSLMKKRHKVQVVEALKVRGFFLLREGVNLAAAALEVSRFTVYNYLNEIEAEAS